LFSLHRIDQCGLANLFRVHRTSIKHIRQHFVRLPLHERGSPFCRCSPTFEWPVLPVHAGLHAGWRTLPKTSTRHGKKVPGAAQPPVMVATGRFGPARGSDFGDAVVSECRQVALRRALSIQAVDAWAVGPIASVCRVIDSCRDPMQHRHATCQKTRSSNTSVNT